MRYSNAYMYVTTCGLGGSAQCAKHAPDPPLPPLSATRPPSRLGPFRGSRCMAGVEGGSGCQVLAMSGKSGSSSGSSTTTATNTMKYSALASAPNIQPRRTTARGMHDTAGQGGGWGGRRTDHLDEELGALVVREPVRLLELDHQDPYRRRRCRHDHEQHQPIMAWGIGAGAERGRSEEQAERGADADRDHDVLVDRPATPCIS